MCFCVKKRRDLPNTVINHRESQHMVNKRLALLVIFGDSKDLRKHFFD